MKYLLRHKNSQKYYSSSKYDYFNKDIEDALRFQSLQYVSTFVVDNLETLADVLRLEPSYKDKNGFTKFAPVCKEDFEVVVVEIKEAAVQQLT